MLYGGKFHHYHTIEIHSEVNKKLQKLKEKFEKSSTSQSLLELSKSVAGIVSSYVHEVINTGVDRVQSKSVLDIRILDASQEEERRSQHRHW